MNIARSKRTIVAAAFWALLGCSAQSAERGAPLSASELQPFRGCQKDDDCVWVQNGCCDCANGGEDTAVARSKVTDFRARFACAGVGCTEVDREPACGAGTVACEHGACVFHPEAP